MCCILIMKEVRGKKTLRKRKENTVLYHFYQNDQHVSGLMQLKSMVFEGQMWSESGALTERGSVDNPPSKYVRSPSSKSGFVWTGSVKSPPGTATKTAGAGGQGPPLRYASTLMVTRFPERGTAFGKVLNQAKHTVPSVYTVILFLGKGCEYKRYFLFTC